DVRQAADVLGAFDVAADPVEAVGDAGEHHGWASSSSSTQVSFDPPPWLELTTSEPRRSATRGSAPGVTRVRSPERMNGRSWRWRGSRRPSTRQGAVDSWMVGWAM